ncbi:hypothetical protein JXB02_03665 [Candidatus Woesearchaeota archaeon]|nr:hypothetical protein [Candidatus Woesearchaeota archaeon]
MKISTAVLEGVIKDVAGEDVIPLVRSLKNKKNISEFKIAENINREINETRNMLYRLYHANLVSFTRRKDKKKGWYIYYWTFNAKRVKYLVTDLKRKKIDRLRERLEREQASHFFACNNRCIRLDFEQATDFEYKCPECGSLMHQEDNQAQIAEISSEIARLEKELRATPTGG